MNSEAVITLQNTSKKYKDFYAVNKASLTIRKGDIYGLVGKNGAGKTTLFKMILGLTNQTEGNIAILGSKSEKTLREQREKIGFFVGSSFFSYLNAYQNIDYFRKLKGIKDRKETARVLEIVGLSGVKKPFKSFSMGMKQRLGIANAILGNPEIIILDEPVNGLDPQGIVDIRNMIKRLNSEFGMTLIVSSHILSELDLIATRFGFIDKGVLLKEVDRDHLHQEQEQTTVIKTNDLNKTQQLLQSTHNIIDIRQENDTLIVKNANVTTDVIAKTIVDNNLQLFELKQVNETLEDFYFKLTGGAQNA